MAVSIMDVPTNDGHRVAVVEHQVAIKVVADLTSRVAARNGTAITIAVQGVALVLVACLPILGPLGTSTS